MSLFLYFISKNCVDFIITFIIITIIIIIIIIIELTKLYNRLQYLYNKY